MFSLQTSSGTVFLLALLSRSGWALSCSAIPPALPWTIWGGQGWTEEHAAGCFAKTLPVVTCRENPRMVAIRDVKLLSQEHAGSKWPSDDGVFAQRNAGE